MHTNIITRTTAYFMLIIGAVNLLMWTFLIASGQVEDFNDKPNAYIFHWISEFGTALLLITAGSFIILKKAHSVKLMFLALGALLLAIGGALYYYLNHFEVVIFIITALITSATVLFILINYRGTRDFLYLSAGLTMYALINMMGQGFQEADPTIVSMSVPASLFMLLLITGLLRKDQRPAAPGYSEAPAEDTKDPGNK